MAFSEAIKVSVRKKALCRCCICQEPFVEIHHIVPQAEDGPDTEDNAAPLCSNCHDRYGDNPKKRKAIREFRDNWYDWVSTQRLQVQFVIELSDHSPRLQTFDDLERHILDLSTTAPMAAYLQLYEAIQEQLRINGRALGLEGTEVWNLRVGVKLLRERLVEPHQVVQKMLEILDDYAALHDKTIMPDDDDEPVTDQDFLSNIALGLKFPRLIRSNLSFIPVDDQQPKIWPVVERPLKS
jgi:HNH endonuclease